MKKCPNVELVPYDRSFLELSWNWLNDPEIKKLTMTPDFSREDQVKFYASLPSRLDYIIHGIEYEGQKIGCCGLKISYCKQKAEVWLYIGEKEYWGKGLGAQIFFSLEKIALSKGMKELFLKVADYNSAATRLYLKCGYVIYEKNEGVQWMRKEINV